MTTSYSPCPFARSAMQAVQLKAEGDKLFKSQDYAAARAQYTAAIAIDQLNAVLWANRGACSWALAEYNRAANDCEVATRLDREYTKAWIRLAKSYEKIAKYNESRDAYGEALKLLQASSLSDAEKSFMQQCQEGMKAVLEKISNGSVATFCLTNDDPQQGRCKK